jgi:glycosyltransferase involved in cell wall biosynthesis
MHPCWQEKVGPSRWRRAAEFDVAFYAPWIGPLLATGPEQPTGGAETQLFLVAHALAERGLRVCLITYPVDSIPATIDGIVVQVQRRARHPVSAIRGALSLLTFVRALAPLRANVFVQRSAAHTTGLVAAMARIRGSRFVYSSANIVDFDFARLERKRWRIWLFRLGVRLADRVVVQTAEQISLCERSFGRTPVLIPSVAETAPQRTESPEAFLWVGRMAPYKRPEAFLALAEAVPEAQFWMVASTTGGVGAELAAELRSRADRLPNLTLLKARPRTGLPELIVRAVAMVNTADYEGMPNVFLEGWARGVPALSLTHDPDGVIVREGLGAFAAGSPAVLAEAARSMWASRRDQRDVAARCRAYVDRQHSVDVVADAWISALRLTKP